MKKKTSKIKNPALRRFLLTLKVTLLVLLSVVFVGGIVFYFTYGKDVISMQQEAKHEVWASTPDTFRETETSVIYDTKGKIISQLKGAKDVYYLTSDEIPEYVKQAFVSIEDKKFYEHTGVDYLAIMRAGLQYLKHGEFTQGGSTITQQLVRNVFISQEKTMNRKIREMFYAMEMEKKYTKEQILEFYINNVYFANGYYGIQAASKGYFGKDVQELSLSQIAFLCAIPNGPTKYDPTNNIENTLERRDLILKSMLDDGKILIEEYQTCKSEEITLKIKTVAKQDYVETFVRYCAVRALMESQGFQFRYDFSSDAERESYMNNYESLYQQCEQSMYSGGYHIYTSISMSKQKKLQNAVNDTLNPFTGKTDKGIYEMQGAAVCIDNRNGRVVAIVGGRKQKSEGYTLNRAFQSYRQPGSSIKPLIVYTPAFESGYTPSSVVNDQRFEGGPRNSDGVYSGNITIRTAVKKSKNVIAWKLFEEITPKVGLSYLLDMGFGNIVANDYYPASSLGGFTNGVSPLEMASGFATIENEGYYRRPTCIEKITDSKGNLIYKNMEREKQIYTKEAAHMMTSSLESVMESGGTGAGLRLYNTACAGKTGTTNDKKDGWFCGFTAYYTTAVWVGYDSPRPVSDLYGSTYPGKIWRTFMEQIHTDVQYAKLESDYYGKDSEKNEVVKATKEPKETIEPEEIEQLEETIDPEVEETESPEETEDWQEGDVVEETTPGAIEPEETDTVIEPIETKTPIEPIETDDVEGEGNEEEEVEEEIGNITKER